MNHAIEETSRSILCGLLQSMKPVRRMAVSVGLIAIALGAPSVESAPVFTNGNFEAGVSTGWDLMNAVNTPGWTITYGSGGFFPRLNLNQDCGGPYGNNNELCQFATLGGPRDEPGGGSALAQTLSGFTVGNSYVLSWLQASEFTEGDWINASITGVGVLSQDFYSNPYPGGTQFWFGPWQIMTFPFVADATTLTFHFQSATGHGFFSEPGIDRFGIADAQIPEPATLALLGAGLLSIVALRKRKQA